MSRVLAVVFVLLASSAWAQQPVNVAAIAGLSPITPRCDDPSKLVTAVISTAASGNTELVALTTSQTIYVCGINFMAAGTVNVRLVYGTGSACGTGETGLTGLYPLVAQTGLLIPNTGLGVQMKTPASNALCIELDAGIGVRGSITYVKE